MQYGDVYCNCPMSGDTFWFDWCDYDTFVSKYVGGYDKGRFIFIV